MDTKASDNPVEINTANFPALHTFLRGYFHQAILDEYGSAPEAAAQFYEDADPQERVPVAQEWRQLSELTRGSAEKFNDALLKLGSAVALHPNDIQEVSVIFARCLGSRPKRHVGGGD